MGYFLQETAGAAEERWFSRGCQPSGGEPVGLDWAGTHSSAYTGEGSESFPGGKAPSWSQLQAQRCAPGLGGLYLLL